MPIVVMDENMDALTVSCPLTLSFTKFHVGMQDSDMCAGDGQKNIGMAMGIVKEWREQWRGVDHMRNHVQMSVAMVFLISQVQKGYLFTSFLDAMLNII